MEKTNETFARHVLVAVVAALGIYYFVSRPKDAPPQPPATAQTTPAPARACRRPPAKPAKDSVVIGMSLEPPVLDSSLNAAAAIREITYQNIYESLTRVDRNGKIVPGLAESWTVSPDGKEYVFKLRSGVKYHDGEAFDASDVKFSIDRLIAPGPTTRSRPSNLYVSIEKVEVVDPQTVKITMKNPDAFVLFNLGVADAAIVDPKSQPTNGTNPVGTGPFKFKERKEGDSLVLVKADTYRNPSAIKLNTVTFKFVKDPSAQINALLAGDVDTFPGFQAPELVGRLKTDNRFAVVIGSTQGETILSTNNGEGKPMAKLEVRQAIAHAINRDELIAAESGFAMPIGRHFSPADPAYVDLTKTYPFDIDKAKALMKAAGYENGFEATLKLPPVGYAKRAGEVMVSQLGKIGIKLVDRAARVAAMAVGGVPRAQLRLHHRGAHRGLRHRSLRPRRLLLELQVRAVPRRLSRDGGDGRRGQARRSAEAAADHHRQGCGQRLPVPARQDRRVEQGSGRHVGEFAHAVDRPDRSLLEVTLR